MSVKLKGYLYFAIESVKGLPVLGDNADRVDTYVSVFLDDMEEAATQTVYDDENPVFNKQLRIKVKGTYDTCSLQVLNAQPSVGDKENLGQVVLDLAKITANGDEQSHSAKLTLRPQTATGDPSKDAVQGTVTFVTKYKAYKKKASKAEREAAMAKAKAEREAERQKQLEAERAELAARLDAERKQQEKEEAARLAAAKALQEQAAREAAQAEAAEQAARAKAERERREAEAKADLERRAAEEAKRAEEIRAAQEKQRAANAARQRMLLEQQQKSGDANGKAQATEALADLDDGMFDADEHDMDNDILAPARGPLTTNTFSTQKAPSQRLSGTVTNVSGGKDGNLYVANSLDKIYWLKKSGGWTQIPGRAICLAAAPDGTVLCANRHQRIYSLAANHRTWTQLPGNMAWISVGAADHIWGVDIQGAPHQYDSMTRSWTRQPGHKFQRIAVGSDGEVWAVSIEQRAFRWNGAGWTGVPGKVKDIAVMDAHGVYATSVVGGIYQWFGNHWRAMEGGEKFHGITVTEHGAWAFDVNGKVYYAPAPEVPKLGNTNCIATMGSNGSFTPEQALDGNPDSFYWSQRPVWPGDQFIVMLLTPVVRQKLRIVTGKPDGIGGADGIVEHGRVEITLDGMSWLTLGNLTNGSFEGALPTLPIRGARIFVTRQHASAIAVRELMLLGIPSRPALEGCSVQTSLGHHGDYDIFKAIDSDVGSFYWSGPRYPKKGDYIELHFSSPVQKEKVIIVTGHPDGNRDFIDQGSLQVSYDGMTFVEKRQFQRNAVLPLVANKPIHAIRIEMESDAVMWVAIREILLA